MESEKGIALQADEVIPPLTDKESAFCARLALGDSMSGACRHVGISRPTGYEWHDKEKIQKEIARYAQIAATNARRMIVGSVRGAVRTVRKLSQSAESEAVRFQAAKYLLDVVKIGELPVGQTQQRIVSRIPRDTEDEVDDTLDTLEAQYQVADLPRVVTPDQLPPDFPRTKAEESTPHYAEPSGQGIPEELTNPEYYRKSRYDT